MKNRKQIVFFCLCALFNVAANFVHPVTPTLIVERNLDSAVFGTALAAMQTTMFLLPPFWGKLCDYVSTKRIMLICCCGYAVGQVIFGAARNEGMVYAGRIFAGCFTGGCFTAFSNYVIHTSAPDARGTNLTAMVTIQTVGGAMGYFVGGLLGLVSVETAFAVQIAVLILCGILFQLCCLDDIAFAEKPDHPLTLKEVNPFSAFVSARAFMTPMLGLLFAVVAVSGIGYNAYEQSFHYYIKDQFHLSSAYNGTIKALVAAMTMVINASVCMYLQKKTDTNKTFLPVLLLTTVPIGCAIMLKSRIPFFGAYLIYNGLHAIRVPVLQTLIANHAVSENSNSVMGFYQSMNSLGSIFGALFAGLIYAVNPMYPFILALLAFAAAGVVGAAYVKRYQAETTSCVSFGNRRKNK